MDDVKDIDVYELLGISSTADESQIRKSYRKKALSCHPDKNPDNPNAALLFLELSKALEVLLDRDKRTAYDKLYNAKKAAKIRHQNLDARRKKFKEDLEFKEQLAQASNKASHFRTREQNLAEEIERLRKEGSRQLKEEMESVRQQIYEESILKTEQEEKNCRDQFKIKIRWKSEKTDPTNGGYNLEKLSKIFSKYGGVADLIVLHKKKGSGLIVFEEIDAARKAYQYERGYPENPLELHWLNETPATSNLGVSSTVRPNESNFSNVSTGATLFPSADNIFSKLKEKNSINLTASIDSDYEAFVFAKLREAEDKKKDVSSTKLD